MDDVDDDERERLRHGGDFITGFQPLCVFWGTLTQPYGLGWDVAAPLALNIATGRFCRDRKGSGGSFRWMMWTMTSARDCGMAGIL